MKLYIAAPQLGEALQTVGRALSARTTNPILEGILLETGSDFLQITASDERLTIITRVSALVEEQGRGVVPGKLFTEFIRRMGEGEIEIFMNDKFQFRLSANGSRTNIAGRDAELYPLPAVMDSGEEISMPQGMLRDMIAKTEFAIAAEDIREVLTGCYLEIRGGEATMVGIDGYRMAMIKRRLSDVTFDMSAIIPGRAAGDLGRLLSDSAEEFCRVSIEKNRLHINLGRTDVFAVLVEGEYVDYKRILPVQFLTRVTCDIETLRRCIDRAALMAREGANHLVRLRITDGEMFIESNSEIGDVHEEMTINQDGGDITISFNVKFIMDVTRALQGEQVEFSFNTPVTPCVITPADDRDYTHMVLPVRTQA